MRISAGGTNICVPENFLHFVQTTPCIDQKACEAVTKVVDAQFGKLRSSSGGIPTSEDRDKRPTVMRPRHCSVSTSAHLARKASCLRAPFFDLWAMAIVSVGTEDEMRQRAGEHFPVNH